MDQENGKGISLMKKQPQKSNLKIDFGTVLLVTGSLANIPLWVGAFTSSYQSKGAVSMWINQVALPILGTVAGFSMGFTAAFGLVYIFVRLSKMQSTIQRKVRGKDEYESIPNAKYRTALGAVILLLLISLIILSPIDFMGQAGKENLYVTLDETLTGMWSVGRVLAADLILGAIALVHGNPLAAGAQQTSKPQSEGSDSASGGSAKSNGRSKPAQRTQANIPCRYAHAGCDRSGTQNAMNAHARACSYKPIAEKLENS